MGGSDRAGLNNAAGASIRNWVNSGRPGSQGTKPHASRCPQPWVVVASRRPIRFDTRAVGSHDVENAAKGSPNQR